MSTVTVLPVQDIPPPDIVLLKAEESALEDEITKLEKEYARSSWLIQKLSKWFTFGPTKKLDWARFKLRLTKKDLASS